MGNQELPIDQDTPALEIYRVRSRHPPLMLAKMSYSHDLGVADLQKMWLEQITSENLNSRPCINHQVFSYDEKQEQL